jgi:hypothetical protein
MTWTWISQLTPAVATRPNADSTTSTYDSHSRVQSVNSGDGRGDGVQLQRRGIDGHGQRPMTRTTVDGMGRA